MKRGDPPRFRHFKVELDVIRYLKWPWSRMRMSMNNHNFRCCMPECPHPTANEHHFLCADHRLMYERGKYFLRKKQKDPTTKERVMWHSKLTIWARSHPIDAYKQAYWEGDKVAMAILGPILKLRGHDTNRIIAQVQTNLLTIHKVTRFSRHVKRELDVRNYEPKPEVPNAEPTQRDDSERDPADVDPGGVREGGS